MEILERIISNVEDHLRCDSMPYAPSDLVRDTAERMVINAVTKMALEEERWQYCFLQLFAFCIAGFLVFFKMPIEGKKRRYVVSGTTLILMGFFMIPLSFMYQGSKQFTGTGVVIGKSHTESYRKWSPATKTRRTIPECWGVTIRPDIEPKTKPEHHIAGFCMNKEAWDLVEVGMPITVDKEKK